MEKGVVILAPALVPLSYLLGGFIVYVTLCLRGRRPPRSEDRERGNFFDFLIHYFVWLLGPIERWVLARRLTPDSLTLSSLVACGGAGLAIGTGHLAIGGWLYVAAGGLDVLDGRLARARGMQRPAGAFLDSVSDRWGELAVFSGFAWFLRDSPWLLAVLLAVAGSVMTSYTRARGEALGIVLSTGLMQRSERMALVSAGTLIAAFFHATSGAAHYAPHILGGALLLTGLGSAGTASARWVRGYRQLVRRAEQNEARARVAVEPDERRAA